MVDVVADDVVSAADDAAVAVADAAADVFGCG